MDPSWAVSTVQADTGGVMVLEIISLDSLDLFVSTAYMISDGCLGQENPSYHKALRFFSTLLNLTPTQIADMVPFPIIVFCYP